MNFVLQTLQKCYTRALSGESEYWDTSVALCKMAHPELKVLSCKEYLVYQGKFGSDIDAKRDAEKR
jgi:hypothetical protein